MALYVPNTAGFMFQGSRQVSCFRVQGSGFKGSEIRVEGWVWAMALFVPLRFESHSLMIDKYQKEGGKSVGST